ncbi:protein translocase subunit SecDF, partial [Staphylococcus aureus]|nr:protein translocase subunit SecDF [Staphylococcus aureus]
KVKLRCYDIKQGSAKQVFKQETKQPTFNFKVKDKNKFKKVTEEISKKRDNVKDVWLDFKKGDRNKKEAQKKKPKYITA